MTIPSPIQVLLVLAFVAAFVGVVRRAKQGAVTRTEAIGWGALWIAASVVVLWPDAASSLASTLGVGRGADLVVYASVALLFFLLFRQYVRIEKLERDITELVRRDALRGPAVPPKE